MERQPRRVSCIPTGEYTFKKNNGQGRLNYPHFDVQIVEGRDGIKIHSGNYREQILGCILVGKELADINKDG